jgi:hypothetical protein
LNNNFRHYGGAGFHALGLDPSCDLRQGLLTFMFDMFDDDAMRRSQAAVLEQLPRMIHAANHNGGGLCKSKCIDRTGRAACGNQAFAGPAVDKEQRRFEVL